MKKIILMLAAVSMAAVAQAQFKVRDTGTAIFAANPNMNVTNPYRVHIESTGKGLYVASKNATSAVNAATILNHLTRNTSGYSAGIDVSSYLPTNQSMNGATLPVAIGVKSIGSRGLRAFGLFGCVGNGGTGAGVYGTVFGASLGENVDACYAGYFDGNTKVDGNLTVTYSILTPDLLSSNSPIRNASEDDCEEDCLGKLSEMSLHTYYYRPEEQGTRVAHSIDGDIEESAYDANEDFVSRQNISKIHYGLSAEELENSFPNLVYDLPNGQKAINYTELIPVLVQCINELGQEVRTLKGENAMLSRGQNTTGMSEVEDTDIISLSQNDPNPWSTQTAIRMNIPERVGQAALFIYDMSGKQLAEHRISGRGDTSLTLTADSLLPGMYIYTLIADGKVISTKRMILTK